MNGRDRSRVFSVMMGASSEACREVSGDDQCTSMRFGSMKNTEAEATA